MRSPMFRRALSALTQANAGPVALSSTRVAAKTPGGAAREPVVLVHGVLASAATYRSLMRREDFGTCVWGVARAEGDGADVL